MPATPLTNLPIYKVNAKLEPTEGGYYTPIILDLSSGKGGQWFVDLTQNSGAVMSDIKGFYIDASGLVSNGGPSDVVITDGSTPDGPTYRIQCGQQGFFPAYLKSKQFYVAPDSPFPIGTLKIYPSNSSHEILWTPAGNTRIGTAFWSSIISAAGDTVLCTGNPGFLARNVSLKLLPNSTVAVAGVQTLILKDSAFQLSWSVDFFVPSVAPSLTANQSPVDLSPVSGWSFQALNLANPIPPNTQGLQLKANLVNAFLTGGIRFNATVDVYNNAPIKPNF